MNLNNRSMFDPRLVRSTNIPLDGAENCEIELYDFHRDLDTGKDWDWKTNLGDGDATPTLIWAGPAQMQVFRFTLTMDGPVGSVDQYRTVRFTVNRSKIGDMRIPGGWVVKVTSCPESPSNTSYQYIVNSGLNSGTPLRRTIEAEVDMTRVWPS